MPVDAAALTFDDGPDPVWTPRVLDVLHEFGATATFFTISERAARYPELVSEILEAGHAVEFHCTRHVRHTETSPNAVRADAWEGLRTLREIGAEPKFWRPPWGICAGWTGELAAEFGLTLVGWTADTHDWRGDGVDEMHEAIGSSLGSGAVVLMHDGLGPGALRGGCEETVALTRAVIPHLRALGCEPAPLDALENVPSPRQVVTPEVSA